MAAGQKPDSFAVAVRKVLGRYVMAKRRALPFEHKEG
jgi:hypothetical protein